MDSPLEFDEESERLLDDLSFYLEGITQTSLAFCGIICNLIVGCVLTTKEMRNSFNLMLVALAFFDSGEWAE